MVSVIIRTQVRVNIFINLNVTEIELFKSTDTKAFKGQQQNTNSLLLILNLNVCLNESCYSEMTRLLKFVMEVRKSYISLNVLCTSCGKISCFSSQ
jgi:hypothetical protein